MAIVFENIDTGETIAIDQQTGGNFYRAKLSAVMNSSNMGTNHDRGQDYGWRLKPEQQAIIEAWEEDPAMIDEVASYTKVPMDSLSHGEFLAYMLHQQELGKSPEKALNAARRDSELAYAARVAQLKALARPELMRPFDPTAVTDARPDIAQVAGDETTLATIVKTPPAGFDAKGEAVAPLAPKAPTEPVTGDAGDHSANDTPVASDASTQTAKTKTAKK